MHYFLPNKTFFSLVTRPPPALDGVSLPSHARRCQPATFFNAYGVSSQCESLYFHPYVFHVFYIRLSYISLVFDRMFSLGVRGGGVDATPVGGRVAVAAAAGAVNGPRRHFLYCSLKPDASSKSRKSRE